MAIHDMREFAFEVRDAQGTSAGFKGDITLIGPPVVTDGSLSVGDMLEISTMNGKARQVRCVEFPLINLGPDCVDWVRVSVTGIRARQVELGSTASTVL